MINNNTLFVLLSLFLPFLLLLLLLNQQLFRPQLLLLLLEVLLLEHLLDASRLQLLVAGLAHITGVLPGFPQTRLADEAVPVVGSGWLPPASSKRVHYVGG